MKIILWLAFFINGLSLYSVENVQDAIHFLNRTSFGPRKEDVEKIQRVGIHSYLEEQLNPATLPLPQSLQSNLNALPTINYRTPQLVIMWSSLQKGQNRQEIQNVFQDACHARLFKALLSPRQLEEMMVDFWFNHFNVFSGKEIDRVLVGSYENEAIRPHVFGKFLDLLRATAKHPAMLFYLDNWQNKAPQFNKKRPKQPQQGINENYARELMELHTLGVEGGYTQKDVIALAHILTGWSFLMRSSPKQAAGVFFFDAKAHDYSQKNFLGHVIPGSGIQEGEQALMILAYHPSTAHHISFQLAQFFVQDEPPLPLVKEMADKFMQTKGDIKSVLRTLFTSKYFWDAGNYSKKFKTPLQYILSVARSSYQPIDNVKPLQNNLFAMGMQLYGCLTPDGYKNTEEAWLSSEGILNRITFASAFANGRLPVSQKKGSPLIAPETLASSLNGLFSEHTLQTMHESPKPIQAAILLASPEFMRK